MARHPQSAKKTLRITEVLSDSGLSLGNLLERAAALSKLEKLLSGMVDPGLAAQFQVANVRENRMILISPSASWATRLRMQAPRLVKSLQQAGYSEIEHIDIRVAPLVERPVDVRQRKPLSQAAIQAFELMGQLKSDETE